MSELVWLTDRNVMVLMVQSSDHVTGLAGLTLTITASKNGAAFASISPTVTDRGSGWYSLALTTSHTDTIGDLALHITGAAADPLDVRFDVVLAAFSRTDLDDLRANFESMPKVLKQSEATAVRRRVYFRVPLQDGGEGTVTGAVSAKVGKNGAAAAVSAGTVGRVAIDASRAYFYYEFTAAELSDLGIVTLEIHVAGTGNPVENAYHFQVVAYDPYAATDLGLSSVATILADTNDIQTRLPAALVSGRMESHVAVIGSAVITAGAIAADAIGASELAADAIAEIAAAVWDELRAGHVTAGSFGEGVIVNSIAANAITASALATDAVTEIQSGLATAAALAVVDDFLDTEIADIQARLPAALVSGRIDASVGAMAANVVTAAAIATDAIDSDAIAASAVTEIQSGLATSAALATVQADTDDIQTRLPAALVSGRMDSSTGAMAAGVVTAAAIATDAIDSDALSASAVSEIAAAISVPSAASVADAVWDEAKAGHVAAGSFGEGVSVNSIATATITSSSIANSAIANGKIASSAISADKFAASAIDATAIATGALTASKFAASAISSTVLAADAIGASQLAADAVSEIAAAISVPSAATVADAVWDEARAGHVAAGSFGEGVIVNSIANAAITAASIATDAISAAKVAADAVTKIADGFLAKTIDGTITVIGALRRLAGLATGLATGLNGTTPMFKRADGTTTAWTATQDTATGERSAVTPGAGLDTP